MEGGKSFDRCIIVDDDADILFSAKLVLGGMFRTVDTFQSPAEAVTAIGDGVGGNTVINLGAGGLVEFASAGQKAEVRMRTPDASGRRKFVGVLRSLTDDKPHQRLAILVGVPQGPDGALIAGSVQTDVQRGLLVAVAGGVAYLPVAFYGLAITYNRFWIVIFALINLNIQRRFTSGHALALYENCYRFVRTGSTGRSSSAATRTPCPSPPGRRRSRCWPPTT